MFKEKFFYAFQRVRLVLVTVADYVSVEVLSPVVIPVVTCMSISLFYGGDQHWTPHSLCLITGKE